jgi:hypothetical protein
MNYGSFIIGFGGLVIAGLSIYLNYKARTSHYREMIYSKQIEGYDEIVNALTEFYLTTLSFIASQGFRLDDTTRPILRSQTMEKNRAFHRKHREWVIFLPNEINKALFAFVKLFNGISVHPAVKHQYPREIVNAEDPALLLGDAYSEVIDVVRACLGTEPLSQETRKLIGKTPDKIEL